MSRLFRSTHHPFDPVWPVQLALIFALSLQLLLPDKFTIGLHYMLAWVEGLLIISLSVTTPRAHTFRSLRRRVNVIILIATIILANAYSLIVVADQLLQPGVVSDGRAVILTAINIFLTNIIIFALWYWEMDGGGPGERRGIQKHEQDFLFAPHRNELYKHPKWHPTFGDYLYLSATNAMAFSPSDVLPLSLRAKMLMLCQAMVSGVTIILVAARAVGILSS
ncbi:MAG TPA: hypothetical protein VK978_02350 [Candidatus Saccharimonadales bacterium]|nr:hypothetical protein [Candidatus Saccharimonadales bacterium]